MRVLTYHKIIDFSLARARKKRAARLTLRISQSAYRFIVFFNNNQRGERSFAFSGDPNTLPPPLFIPPPPKLYM